MKLLVARWWRNPFHALAGPLPSDVRYNFNVDLLGALCFGVFFAAAVSFVPVVLRRLGATEGMLAFYTTSTYFGSFLSLFSLMFLRRFPSLPFALTTWTIGRGFFLATALVTGPALPCGPSRSRTCPAAAGLRSRPPAEGQVGR